MSTTTAAEVTDILTPPPPTGRCSVLLFWASWHAPSRPGGDVDGVFRTLASAASASGDIDFFRVEAEAVPDLSLKYGVNVVPTFVLLDGLGAIVDRVDGGDDIPRLTQAVGSLSSSAPSSVTSLPAAPPAAAETNADVDLEARLKSLTTSSQTVLFMKGTPASPKCGFSRQAIELLSGAGISFGTFDILTDDAVREGLKTYSDWPTYPQLYVKGELMGGLDILKEMANDDGESLADQLGLDSGGNAGPETKTLDERLRDITNRQRIMLFMKGLPSAPKCGFSRQIVEMLDRHSAKYDSFNILEDEEVRAGLKVYSDWPTYPQLYVDGDLVGGLDIVKEMEEGGDLADLIKEG